jgi:hypothetical protein
VRFRDAESIAGSDELTPDSIQENPKLGFYTTYKRETREYDTEYMQNYNEDLKTTLIFVRFCIPNITVQH